MSVKIQAFIFNWKARTENTLKIEKTLNESGLFDKVVVINSDPEIKKAHWFNIGDYSNYINQYIIAMNLFDGDIFFQVMADSFFNNWINLTESAIEDYKKYNWGIYAPFIEGTWYNSENSDINSIIFENDKNLKMISCPDAITLFVHKDIMEKMKLNPFDFSFCTNGWGIDILMCANSFLLKRPVIRNYDYTVVHPQGVTSYSQETAINEFSRLINSCSNETQELIYNIRFNKEKLAEIFI